MNSESLEKIIADALLMPTGVSRDVVRDWVVAEKRDASKRFIKLGVMGVLAVLLMSAAWGWVLTVEMERVRMLVGNSPSKSLREFTEMTNELVGAQPAEHFMRHLSARRSKSISSLAANSRR